MALSLTPLELEARSFAQDYARLFSSPKAASKGGIPEIAKAVSVKYRPGVTFFTNGQISRFETQEESAQLIEREMQKALSDGLGVCLLLQDIKTIVYSDSAVTCWLKWKFQPPPGSEFAERAWTFENIYGYRAAVGQEAAGWEYVVRDNEVEEMRKATGMVFN